MANMRMCGFFFFGAVDDPTSGSCFIFCHGQPLPMADVALVFQ
jgi:hypothetical protein